MHTIKNPYYKSIISLQYSYSVLIFWFIRLKGRLMEFEIGVVGTYGCAGFRVELRIHIISNMMRVVVTDRMFSKIANIRHGVWTKKKNGRAQLLPLLLRLWNQSLAMCCLLLTRCWKSCLQSNFVCSTHIHTLTRHRSRHLIGTGNICPNRCRAPTSHGALKQGRKITKWSNFNPIPER